MLNKFFLTTLTMLCFNVLQIFPVVLLPIKCEIQLIFLIHCSSQSQVISGWGIGRLMCYLGTNYIMLLQMPLFPGTYIRSVARIIVQSPFHILFSFSPVGMNIFFHHRHCRAFRRLLITKSEDRFFGRWRILLLWSLRRNAAWTSLIRK